MIGVGINPVLVKRQASASFTPPMPSYTGTMVETEDADYRYYQLTSDGNLTFDKAGLVEYEIIGGGGGGGGRNTIQSCGGGGGSFPIRGSHIVDDVTSYPIVVGTGGAGGNDSPGAKGGTTSVFGVTAEGGGAGHYWNYGLVGACSGGAWAAFTSVATQPGGTIGYSGAPGSPDQREGGAGGGAGGDAIQSTGVGDQSAAGPGVTSILGDTICEGGLSRLTSDNGPGRDATTAGSGGEGASSNPQGGNGADGRVIIRIPKNYETTDITIDAAPELGFGYTLNSSLTTAPVLVTGTMSSHDGNGTIEVRAVEYSPIYNEPTPPNGGWQDVTCSGGTFSGVINVPAHPGRLQLEARLKGTNTVWKQDGYWFTAVGVVFNGQSNTLGAWTAEGWTETPRLPRLPILDQFIAYRAFDSTFPGQTVGVSVPNDGVRAYATELYSHTNLPMVLVVSGMSSVNRTYLLPGTVPFDHLTTALGSSHADVSHIHAIEVHQGESDNGLGTNITNWLNDWESIRSGVAALTGQTADSILMQMSNIGTETYTDGTGTTWQTFRHTLQEVEDFGRTNVFRGAHNYPHKRVDEFHYTGTGYARRMRMQARLMAWRLGFASDPGRFYISGAEKTSGTRTTVQLTHGLGSDFTIETKTPFDGSSAYDDPPVPSKIDSFEVSTDGVTWTTVAGADVARATATTITLDHADLGTGTRYVRYAYAPEFNGYVLDNSGYEWPLDVTGADGVAVKFFVDMSGLTDGAAIVGDHGSISYTTSPVSATETVKWSDSGDPADPATYGTGNNPTNFAAGDGSNLYLHVTDMVDGQAHTVTRSALIRHQFGTAPNVADQSDWIVGQVDTTIDGSASGANLNFTYVLEDAPSGVTIDTGTGLITVQPDAVSSGTATIIATDKYGTEYTDTFAFNVVPVPVSDREATLQQSPAFMFDTADLTLYQKPGGGAVSAGDDVELVTDITGNNVTLYQTDPADMPAVGADGVSIAYAQGDKLLFDVDTSTMTNVTLFVAVKTTDQSWNVVGSPDASNAFGVCSSGANPINGGTGYTYVDGVFITPDFRQEFRASNVVSGNWVLVELSGIDLSILPLSKYLFAYQTTFLEFAGQFANPVLIDDANITDREAIRAFVMESVLP